MTRGSMGDRSPVDTGSIYGHIRAHLPADGPGLLPGGDHLPDEPKSEPGDIRLAPGLLDEILDPGSTTSQEQAAAASFRLVENAVRNPSAPEPYERLYEDLRTQEQIGFLDPLVTRIYRSQLPKDGIHEVAVRLASRSRDRMPVKVGIALLGWFHHSEDRDVLLTLGRHEEFTQYVGATLMNAFRDPEPVLWELAKSVTLWGRIALVRQLATTRRPDIKAWILRDGSRDFLVHKQLAYVAATAGELAKELQADDVDDDLLVRSGEILSALIEMRPFVNPEDIDHYEDAPEAVRSFLLHVSRAGVRLEYFQPVAAVLDYLLGADRGDGALPVRWSPEESVRASTLARWILRRPEWRPLIEDGLRSPDAWTFMMAEWAARKLGDDTIPVLLARLRGDPNDGSAWFLAATLVEDARVDELLELGCERLRRRDFVRGPNVPGWLLIMRQELARFPGKGWPLFQLALTSPYLPERRLGLSGLEGCPEGHWPPEADPILEIIAQSDPDEEIREWAATLLAKSSGSPGETTP